MTDRPADGCWLCKAREQVEPYGYSIVPTAALATQPAGLDVEVEDSLWWRCRCHDTVMNECPNRDLIRAALRAATPDPAEPGLREALEGVLASSALDSDDLLWVDRKVREALTADTIAARALYATGGNAPTTAIEDSLQEVRRWVVAIGCMDPETRRRYTKADALREIDRVLDGLP